MLKMHQQNLFTPATGSAGITNNVFQKAQKTPFTTQRTYNPPKPINLHPLAQENAGTVFRAKKIDWGDLQVTGAVRPGAADGLKVSGLAKDTTLDKNNKYQIERR